MTKKALLQEWATAMGAQVSASATVSELEAEITHVVAKSNQDFPKYTLREGVENNWRVIREELPSTIAAVVTNLRS